MGPGGDLLGLLVFTFARGEAMKLFREKVLEVVVTVLLWAFVALFSMAWASANCQAWLSIVQGKESRR